MKEAGVRPYTILVAALGGEGGGVLADWLVDAADREGYPVQSTSIPGVSQRTGATTYYVEIFPQPAAALAGRQPVMALVPCAGAIDMVAATELVEAARAMQNAFVTPARTTLVAATHRIYATSEKMVAVDGRYDSARIVTAARTQARRAILADLAALAREAGTVINAVLFGAMAGSGELPLSRAACEAAIAAAGKGAEASLRGFALGYAAAAGAPAPVSPKLPPSPPADGGDWRQDFPADLHPVLAAALPRLAGYQDAAYADLYLDRLRALLATAAGDVLLLREAARLLALWMCYEDGIRVAELKTRPERFARLRAQMGVKDGQRLRVVDYLKPGTEELAAMLPAALGRRLLAWEARRGRPWRRSLQLDSTGLVGHGLLRLAAACKPWRRRSGRYAEEQALIGRWLAAVGQLAGRGELEAARELVQCARLIRGYGDTQRRCREAFVAILAALDAAGGATAVTICAARQTALADPEAKAKPVVWMSRV